jgi:hypothetical protein
MEDIVSIYEVPLGLCGAELCPEEDLDCWVCTINCIREDGFDTVCSCGSELCAVCNLIEEKA